MGLGNNQMSTASDSLSSALAQLRIKLLDLSGRNRLINFKHTAGKSMQFVEGELSAVYEKLVESNSKSSINILGLPEPQKHDWVSQHGRLQRPDPRDWAKSQNIPTSFDISSHPDSERQSNLRSLMYADDLAKHCRKIEREAVLAIEETGANMLFLVLGFLEFPDQRDSEKSLAAPLICVPAAMQKKDTAGIQTFSLQFTGDDISENLSLREKLKNDFGIVLPELDEDQIDIESYFREIQEIIKDLPGFTIKRRVSLCLLSFSNMLLVRDLDPTKWPQIGGLNSLINHPIVREVFEGAVNSGGQAISIASEHQVEEGPGADIPLVYDADSSQHSALIDVLVLKKNLVIEGPPGTGKSQTITNLIAACLSQGKKVLFVAEKLAALEVVKNRLSMAGLDPFVLELHSNKTNKKQVLEEVGKRMAYKPKNSPELTRLQSQYESHRKELKTYSDLINSITRNSVGLTLHQIMWSAEKFRASLTADEAHLSHLFINDATQISEFELSKRMDCLKHLGDQYSLIGRFDYQSTFWGYFPDSLTPGDEERINKNFEAALEWAEIWVENAQSITNLLGGNVVGLSSEFCDEQLKILNDILDSLKSELPFHLAPNFFAHDVEGNESKKILIDFQAKIDKFQTAIFPLNKALLRESSVNKKVLEELLQVQKLANYFGFDLATHPEINGKNRLISEHIIKLKASLEFVIDFTKRKSIPFDGAVKKLNRLAIFTKLIVDAPEAHLHLQMPGLMRDDAIQQLERLQYLQSDWTALEHKLNELLYLDVLPAEEKIKQAMLTFREGDAWYRIFQKEWRSAIALHKSIQKKKVKISAAERLAQLEQITKFSKSKKSWKSDIAWVQIFGVSEPLVNAHLDGHVALAKWNQSIKIASEEIQINLIDPGTFTANQARALRREFQDFSAELSVLNESLKVIFTALPKIEEIVGAHLVENIVSISSHFLNDLAPQLAWLQNEAQQTATYEEVIEGCEAAELRKELVKTIAENIEAKNLLGDLFEGTDTDVASALEVLNIGQNIDGLNLSAQIKSKLKNSSLLDAAEKIRDALKLVGAGLNEIPNFVNTLNEFGDFQFDEWLKFQLDEDLLEFTESFVQKLEESIADKDLLIPWSLYNARRAEAIDLQLKDFVRLLEDEATPPGDIGNSYGYCCFSSIIREVFKNNPQLSRFSGLKHNQIRDEFQRIDKEIIALKGKVIGQECSRQSNPPYGFNGAKVNDKTEMVLLNYLLPQQRPRMPVRKMLTRAGASIQALKPCFMMGPQAVAQYLTPGAIKFDLVIMDEASQLKPEEAIGAIARGGQLVVVGDPKQLPPTSFFSRMNPSEDDDEKFTTTDAESILDVCSSHFQPIRSLRWHYRSQHHSLIAFSNLNFYRSNLIIFPSPYGQGGKLGVRAVYLADAVYENQTNLREAKRVVDAVVDHINTRPNESVGVVTLNIKQRDLIAELLDERLKSIKAADIYRERWKADGQPLFIKNLENVQGDERDAIIISTTFGKPAGSSAVRQNFGPISRQGGWRRLNVLFTRAKRSVAVYTSLRPEDIVSDGTTPEGTKALRNYLEYARTGSLSTIEETGREPDSDFEISVMDVLRSRGYEVTPQLGVAGFRIDIAVKHPGNPPIFNSLHW